LDPKFQNVGITPKNILTGDIVEHSYQTHKVRFETQMQSARTIAWSTSLHEIRSAPRAVAPCLVVGGKFGLSAIMQLVVSIARRFGSSCQLDWKGRTRLGLRTAWKRAKEAMAAAAAPVRPAQPVRAVLCRAKPFLFPSRSVAVPTGVTL
jgi:hypothetical protein